MSRLTFTWGDIRDHKISYGGGRGSKIFLKIVMYYLNEPALIFPKNSQLDKLDSILRSSNYYKD